MILSKKWLSDYVTIDTDIRTFSEKMTMSGSKVEGYEVEGSKLKNIVVGKIISIVKHEDADTLFVCMVNIGEHEPIQIVTGADNLNVNDVIPVALHKSVVHGGKQIKRGKLRGVQSNGMLCSLQELGLTVHDFPNAVDDGIFVLSDDCDTTLGLDIQTALGLNDTAIEFEITPNRPDCLSVIGLAREVAATFDVPLTTHKPEVKNGHGTADDFLSVEIHTDKCYRYIGAIVENVRIAPSPLWLRERLRASGIRPINNIVDITNYVMLEYGQPMHAFDLRYLKGGKVNVRMAKDGETITTLDDAERSLSTEMMVIADAEKPVAVAGVMGGEFSGIMDDTSTIVFESACFNGVSVRKTAQALGMRTESSSRFEKELSPATCPISLARALELVQELDAGDVVNNSVDVNNADLTATIVKFDHEWINTFLGTDIPRTEQVHYLEQIEFVVHENEVTVPLFRGDVTIPADLSEEVARFYGYDNIPLRELSGVANGRLTQEQILERLFGETLRALGLNESITFSFYSQKAYDMIHLPEDSPYRKSVIISNPLGEETSIMRTTAVPSMMNTIQKNYNTRILSGAFYEMAMVYLPVDDEKLPHERISTTLGLYGEEYDFHYLKGVVEELLSKAGISEYDVVAVSDNPTYHPGRTASITKDGKELVVLGQVHPDVAEEYGVDSDIYIAEVNFETVFELRNLNVTYMRLPKYPATTRDLAFVCDKDIPVLTLERDIEKAVGGVLESIKLFDVYEGEQLGENKKSVAFNLVLRSSEKTLTDKEVDKAMDKAITVLKKRDVELRS